MGLRTLLNIFKKRNKIAESKIPFNPLPFSFNQPSGYSDEAAIKEFKGWVYGLSMLNGRAVAQAPFHLYTKSRTNQKCLFKTRKPVNINYLKGSFSDHAGKIIRPSNSVLRKTLYNDFEEVIEDHPVINLLQAVNPYQNSFEFLLCIMIDLQITGNAYIYKIKDPIGIPVEIWSLPAWRMSVNSGNPQKGEPFIKGYSWRANLGSTIDFSPDEIIHIKNGCEPEDRLYGQGFVEAAWDQLKVQNATMLSQAAWLENLARPDWLINLKSGDDDSVNKLQARLNVALRGPKNTGRMIVGGWGDGFELHQLNFKDSPFDSGIAQLGQTAKSPILECLAHIWQVPMSMILANDPNRANAQTGEYFYAVHTVMPWLRRLEDAFNEFLLPDFGIQDDAFIAFDNIVPVDKLFLITTLDQLMKGGALYKNELRTKLGMDHDPTLDGQLAVPIRITKRDSEEDQDQEPSDQQNNGQNNQND